MHYGQLTSNQVPVQPDGLLPVIACGSRSRWYFIPKYFAMLIILAVFARVSLAEEVPDSWQFAAGVGGVNTPRYPGSRDYFTQVLPIVSVEYGRYFLGALPGTGTPAGLGAYLVRNDHWQLGIGVDGDARKPRRASDAPILHGWGNIDSTERGALFGSYTLDWFVIRGVAAADIGGKHEGVLASLEMLGRFHPIEGLTLSAGPEVVLGDRKYTQTFFGINAAQSAIAGVRPYSVKGGVNTLRFSVGADYMLTTHVLLGAHAEYGRLQREAADSPVTADKTQHLFGLFALYRF
jgi:outer membrane protein